MGRGGRGRVHLEDEPRPVQDQQQTVTICCWCPVAGFEPATTLRLQPPPLSPPHPLLLLGLLLLRLCLEPLLPGLGLLGLELGLL